MNKLRSSEDQNLILEKTFESKGVRAGVGLAAAGVISASIGVGDYVLNNGEYTREMLACGYLAMTIGALVASGFGIRVINQHDRAKNNG